MRERGKKRGRRQEKSDYAGDDAGQGLSGTSVLQLIEEAASSLDILSCMFSPVTLCVCVCVCVCVCRGGFKLFS